MRDETLAQHHEQLRDDLAGYALGALDADADARVETHLRNCAECQQALSEYHDVLQLLPLGLPVTQPSPASRAALLSRTRSGATGDTRLTIRPSVAWWSRVRFVVAGFVAALLLFISVTAWQRSSEPETRDTTAIVEQIRNDPDALVMPMAGSDAAPDARANLFIEPGDDNAALVVSGLPQPPDGREYQFWFIGPDSSRFSGGVFAVDRSGWTETLLTAPVAFSTGWSCGVSEEPIGGSSAPTGRNVLRAAYGTDYQYAP